MNEWIKRILPELRKIWFIPVMLILGVLLMVYQGNTKEAVPVAAITEDDQYIAEIEKRLEEMLNEIEGVGACRVTVTLASGSKKEYVREAGNVLVISDNEGNESAVVSKEIAPEIAGVTVLMTGDGSIEIEKDIIYSVSTVLGIGTNKVCVIQADKE